MGLALNNNTTCASGVGLSASQRTAAAAPPQQMRFACDRRGGDRRALLRGLLGAGRHLEKAPRPAGRRSSAARRRLAANGRRHLPPSTRSQTSARRENSILPVGTRGTNKQEQQPPSVFVAAHKVEVGGGSGCTLIKRPHCGNCNLSAAAPKTPASLYFYVDLSQFNYTATEKYTSDQ